MLFMVEIIVLFLINVSIAINTDVRISFIPYTIRCKKKKAVNSFREL